MTLTIEDATALTVGPAPKGPARWPRSARIRARCRSHRWRPRTAQPTRPNRVVLARYYDPVIGRFAATDPLINTSQTASLDAYGYGRGNPVALSDPTGLDPDTSAIFREEARRRGGCTASCPGGETSPPSSRPNVITVKPESVTVFNPTPGPRELAGCGCETTGGDDFSSLFTNKEALNDLANHPLYILAPSPVGDGLQALAAINECLDGGKLINCGYAWADAGAGVFGADALAELARAGNRWSRPMARYLAGVVVDATAPLAEGVKEATYDWIQERIFASDEMAPGPFGDERSWGSA